MSYPGPLIAGYLKRSRGLIWNSFLIQDSSSLSTPSTNPESLQLSFSTPWWHQMWDPWLAPTWGVFCSTQEFMLYLGPSRGTWSRNRDVLKFLRWMNRRFPFFILFFWLKQETLSLSLMKMMLKMMTTWIFRMTYLRTYVPADPHLTLIQDKIHPWV